MPRKTFKKLRLAVAESGARLLSVRDAGTGVYTTEVFRTKVQKKKRYTEVYAYVYVVVRVEIMSGARDGPA